MGDSYQEMLRRQQAMQQQQLQAQIDQQNQIIANHNASIQKYQQEQLDHIRNQTNQMRPPVDYKVYRPSADYPDNLSGGNYNNKNGNYNNNNNNNNYQPYPSGNNQQNQGNNNQNVIFPKPNKPKEDPNYIKKYGNGVSHNEEVKDETEPWKIAAGVGGGLLAAAGLAYGGYKIYEHHKEKKEKEEQEALLANKQKIQQSGANVPGYGGEKPNKPYGQQNQGYNNSNNQYGQQNPGYNKPNNQHGQPNQGYNNNGYQQNNNQGHFNNQGSYPNPAPPYTPTPNNNYNPNPSFPMPNVNHNSNQGYPQYPPQNQYPGNNGRC